MGVGEAGLSEALTLGEDGEELHGREKGKCSIRTGLEVVRKLVIGTLL